MPGAFELTTYGDGRPKRVDWKTRAALEAAEHLLDYPLTIVQGSYNSGGVSASAGTHDGGGVVDLLSWDWQRKVRALRTVGFAAWYRPPVRGLWGPHIHAVLIDHGKLAPVAARQVIAYRGGRDGLRSNLPDRFWRPSPIPVFHYPPKNPAPTPARREARRTTAPTAGAPSHRTGRWTGSTPATSRAARSTSRPPRPPGCAGGTSRPPRATRSRTRRTASA